MAILQPGDDEWEMHRRLLQVREAEHGLVIERTRFENELKLVIGTAAGLDGIATWKSHSVKKFDEASFKRTEPDLYEAFVREARTRKFLLR